MKIMKFGGAVLNSPEGFIRMKNITDKNRGDKQLIIVSALSKATRNLKEAAAAAKYFGEPAALKVLDNILDYHNKFIDSIISDENYRNQIKSKIQTFELRIRDIIRGISITRELTPMILDEILSFGELFAVNIVDNFFRESGFNHKYIDSASVIVTDSRHGRAKPILDKTTENVSEVIIPAFNNYDIILTQGFVAKSINGRLTTMGIESSNLTAALYASLLDCNEVTIWTDVEGVRSMDPKLCKDTYSIPKMDYKTAYRAAESGLKLIYPGMAAYLTEKNIKADFRFAGDIEGDYTEIGTGDSHLPFIVNRNGLALHRFDYSNPKEKDLVFENLQNEFSSNNIFGVHVLSDSLLVIKENNGQAKKAAGGLHLNEIQGVSAVTVLNADKILTRNILKFISATEGILFIFAEEDELRCYVNDNDLLKIMNIIHDTLNEEK